MNNIIKLEPRFEDGAKNFSFSGIEQEVISEYAPTAADVSEENPPYNAETALNKLKNRLIMRATKIKSNITKNKTIAKNYGGYESKGNTVIIRAGKNHTSKKYREVNLKRELKYSLSILQ